MKELLNFHKLRLLQAMYKVTLEDTFEEGIEGWEVDADFHQVTVDSNADKSSGLDGSLAINCFGSYDGGRATKTIYCDTYSEISFEHYVQNDTNTTENSLKFFVDGVLKLDVRGPSPWTRCQPIGLTPGEHELKFIYNPNGSVSGKKGVVDTIIVHEARELDCIVMSQTPPCPHGSVAASKPLRGYTNYQEATVKDTVCKFTAGFNGLAYKDFTTISDGVFYYVDEFGTCYRGVLADGFSPKNIALNSIYTVDMSLMCPNKCGIGFC